MKTYRFKSLPTHVQYLHDHDCLVQAKHIAGGLFGHKEEVASLKAERQRQSELLEKLTTDNSRLISQVHSSTFCVY